MNQEKILALLKQAYACSLRLDARTSLAYMERAREAIDALPEDRALRGEWLLVSLFQDIRDFDRYLDGLERAAALIGGRSRVLPAGTELFEPFPNPFILVNMKPGFAEKNVQRIRRAQTLFQRLTGGGGGTTESYLAVHAHFRGELVQARAYAKRALEIAQHDGQAMTALAAADALANVARHAHDEPLWRFAMGYVRGVAAGKHGASLEHQVQAQVMVCVQELGMGLLHNAPDWLREARMGVVPCAEGAFGFRVLEGGLPVGIVTAAMIAEVQYLSYSGKPDVALGVADMLGKVYDIHGMVLDAYLEFFRAVCYWQLKEERPFREALRRGVELIAPDGLWLIAAEFYQVFQSALVEEAAHVAKEAPARIRALGEGFLEKLSYLRREETRDAPESLSDREREVFELLLAGKKNAEIAQALHISPGTVKKHVESIYRKGNVSSREELIELQKRSVKTAVWVEVK